VNRYALRLALERGTLVLEQKGGHERVIVLDDGGDEWRRLYEQWLNYDGDVLALTICPDSDPVRSDCAYRRVRAKLMSLAEACGITVERVHMHRFRRTFGMHFYRATRDVVLTGKALGHGRGSRATLSYLDEAEPERVAEVVRDLRAKGKR
jgi:site-specific recombinase XerD